MLRQAWHSSARQAHSIRCLCSMLSSPSLCSVPTLRNAHAARALPRAANLPCSRLYRSGTPSCTDCRPVIAAAVAALCRGTHDRDEAWTVCLLCVRYTDCSGIGLTLSDSHPAVRDGLRAAHMLAG